tara:strand:+ start:3690 stop:5027 length:1338 start_codon:yes stop_codon:yes gene_type:complete
MHSLKSDAEKSKEISGLLLSKDSLKVIQVYGDMETLKDSPGADRIIKKLNVARAFYSAAFELMIAAGYKRKGYNVEFLPESSHKTPDIKISSPSFEFYVECKSLEDKIRKSQAVWEKMSREVSKLAKEIDCQIGITVRAKRYVGHKEASAMLEEIKGCLQVDRKRYFDFGFAEAWLEFFEPFNDWLPFSEIKFDKLDLGRMEFAVENRGAVPYMSQFSFVNIKNFFSEDCARQVKRLFKKASKQLPRNSVSVLHIEIPNGAQEDFIKSLDFIYPILDEKINRPSCPIDAIVVGALSQRLIVRDSTAAFLQAHAIIPSSNSSLLSRHKISLLGATDPESVIEKIKASQGEGTIYFEFIINDPVEANLGEFIFSAVSGDGRYQVSVALASKEIIRIEMVMPKIKRSVEYFHVNKIIRVGKINKMAISFEYSDLRAFINGSILGKAFL